MSILNSKSNFYKLNYSKHIPEPEIIKTSGKYCIEISYISGNACFIAGYKTTKNHFITLFGNQANPTLWYNNKFTSMNLKGIQAMNAYAVLIDINSKLLSVIHGSEKYEYNFASEVESNEKYKAIVLGGCGESHTDNVWVNFGENKFVNSIPIGYKPWMNLQKNTCQKSRRNHSICFMLIATIS